MTLDLPEPRHADKALHAGFITASVLAHAMIVLAVALFGGGSRGGAGGERPAGAARGGISSETEVAVAEKEDDVALDELASRAAQAAPEPEPVFVAKTQETPAETFEVPAAPPSASVAPPPAPPRTAKPRAPRAPSSASAAPTGTGSSSAPAASASAGSGTGDAPGDGEGHAKKAPDLAAKFTKELPTFANAIEDWKTMPMGQAGSIRVSLLLDADGKVVQTHDPVPSKPPPPPALAEAVRRVAKGLRMTLALPGHPVRAGRLEVTVSARVEQGPARERLKLGTSGALVNNHAQSEFVLESGLKVTFDVTVESVKLD